VHDPVNQDSDPGVPLVATGAARGRVIFALIAVVMLGLLLFVKVLTQVGSEKGGWGWWNEPAFAPAVFLTLTVAFASAAFLNSSRQTVNRAKVLQDWGIVVLLCCGFLFALWLIPLIGYGLATLFLALFSARFAGFRGRSLLYLALGVSATMVVLFRLVLEIWFPLAKIFKLFPMFEPIGRFL